jgi:hypothetical protein
MFDSHAATLGGARHRIATRTGGVAGNARLTGAVAVGLLPVPPVALKLGSTGYRFARYYTDDEPYVRKGPPPTVLRFLAPGVVLTTLALLGTGAGLRANAIALGVALGFVALSLGKPWL